MKREELIAIGFKEIPHFTVGNTLVYDLGRTELSISSLGTPNEMVFLSESVGSVSDFLSEKGKIPPRVKDIICLRNYDYDGYTSLEEIKQIIQALSVKPR